MRTISLRQFRDHIADITEPVEVQRRDGSGNFQVLGQWRPLSDHIADIAEEMGHQLSMRPAVPAIVPARNAQQAERDRILARVNRGG